MRFKPRSEMSKLTYWLAIPTLLLVVILIAVFLIYGINTANKNERHTKQILVDQTVQSFKKMGENFTQMNFNASFLKSFNPEFLQSFFKGDPSQLYNLMLNLTMIASPSEYGGLISNGKLYGFLTKSGVTVDRAQLATAPPAGDYKMLSTFGNLKGNLLNIFYPIDLTKIGIPSKIYMSTVYDITKEVKSIDDYTNSQKRNTIITLVITGVIALVLFGLLTTVWLRYLINRFIASPITKLNTMAEEITSGTFVGDVVVDSGSDFAALQGLLKSGQLILRKFDADMSGPNA
jgi:hypothetical protein